MAAGDTSASKDLETCTCTRVKLTLISNNWTTARIKRTKVERRRLLVRDRVMKKAAMGMRPSRKKMGRKMMNIRIVLIENR